LVDINNGDNLTFPETSPDLGESIIGIADLNRAVIDNLRIGFTIFDENTNVIDVNKASLELFDCDKQYYMQNFLRLNPEFQPNGEKSYDKALELFKRAMNGEDLLFEWTHRTPKGELIPFEISLSRAEYKGKYIVINYQYDLRNIIIMTEELHKQSELLKAKLKQQELISDISRSFVSSSDSQTLLCKAIAKLGNYLNVSTVAIINIDHENKNTNVAYDWISSVMPHSNRNLNLYEIAHTYFPGRLYDIVAVPVISCPDTNTSNVEAFHSFSAINISAFICVPLYVEGHLWGMLTVHQYVPRIWTENEKSFIAMTAGTIANAIMLDTYNTKLKDAVKEITAASRAKSDFLSNMSHEMRTPMNAIINMTAIGRRAEDLERKNYTLDKIQDASVHLLGVINDILDMSKIEANKFELSPAEFVFDKMLQRVINVVNFRVEEKNQKLVVNIDRNIPKVLIGDDQRLSQVITNLLGNAVKFTPEDGSIKLDAELIAEKNEICTIQVSITDTGIGISEEQQQRLFQSFHQAETSTVRKYGGTGLGLSICKSIVEMMNGKIWVESEPGKGSTFSFMVQVKHGDEEKQYLDEMKEKHQKDTDKSKKDNDFSGRRILLAEDVEINREIVLSLLDLTHLEIDCAENGKQAVEMFCEEPGRYEMIFMDVQMPEMDGYEATRRIRQFESMLEPSSRSYDHIPIIAMTANVFREDIENCIEAGMDDHLGKPLDYDMLMEKLCSYLK